MSDRPDRKLTRRDFVQSGAALAAAGVAGRSTLCRGSGRDGARPAEADVRKTRSYNPQMEYRRLGKSGLWVSAVCLGGHWKRVDKLLKSARPIGGCSRPSNKADVPAFEANRSDIVGKCIELGINLVDACSPGEILTYAKVLKGRRDKMYFSYSWHTRETRFRKWRTAKALIRGLEQGMEEAGLETIDLWRISADMPGRHTDAENEEMAKALAAARKSGKVRCTGVSSHSHAWLRKMIEAYPDEIQVVLFPYTAKSQKRPEGSLFDAMRKHDVGSLGIKPFANNSLFKGNSMPDSPHAAEDDRRARLAVRHILAGDGVTAPIPGLITPHQVNNVCRALKERREQDLTDKKASLRLRAELADAAEDMWSALPRDYQWLKRWEYV